MIEQIQKKLKILAGAAQCHVSCSGSSGIWKNSSFGTSFWLAENGRVLTIKSAEA